MCAHMRSTIRVTASERKFTDNDGCPSVSCGKRENRVKMDVSPKKLNINKLFYFIRIISFSISTLTLTPATTSGFRFDFIRKSTAITQINSL